MGWKLRSWCRAEGQDPLNAACEPLIGRECGEEARLLASRRRLPLQISFTAVDRAHVAE